MLRKEWIRFEESFPSVSTLIWEPTSDFEAEEAEKVILLFPGNPGNIDFYTEFLSRLKVFDSKIVIFGVSYLGHCPQRMKDKYDEFEMERENEREKENENENGGGALYSLEDQKKHVVCVYSYLLNRYKNSQITLIGHSVGAYMNLCVIHARLNDFKSGRIERVIQLFPTVHKIRETPQGNLLSPLFNPFSRFLVRGLMSFVQSFVNCNLRKWLLEKFVSIKVVKNGDFSALSILNEMVDPWLVDNCIFMASQEMAEIGCLQEFLSFEIQSCASLQSKISHYFGLTDRWVPIESHANTISSTFLKHSNHHFCNQGISHAFVLDDKHAAIIADHCLSIIMGKERE